MENIYAIFVEHGLLVVSLGVFLEQAGVPIPAVPFLFLAGVTGAHDGVFAFQSLLVATLAAMMADYLWFLGGQKFGRRVLGLLCRVSLSPDSCVRQSELSFARRGVATLVVAKFVPGLSLVARPLAGALGMRLESFLMFNLAGTVLWAGSGIALGVIFHDQLASLMQWLENMGSIALVLMGALLAVYVAVRAWRRWRLAQLSSKLPRIQAGELAELLQRQEDTVVVDVRAQILNAVQDDSIPGARHIDLNTLAGISFDDWPQGAHTKVVTYCACPNDASAVKAALLLLQKGFKVRVLQGGIEAWSKAGFPLQLAQAAA